MSTKRRTNTLAATAAVCVLIATGALSYAQESYPPATTVAIPAEGADAEVSSQSPTEQNTTAQVVLENRAEPRPSVEINAGDAISAVPKRFQYGFRLNMRGVYDDNIFLNHVNPVSDFYFAIEPGVTFGFGDIVGHEPNFIRFDYAPSVFLYVDRSDADAIQHIMKLEGQYRFGHLSLGLTQEILLLDGTNPGTLTNGASSAPGVNLDAGGDTEVDTYATNATLSYDLTGKTFLSGGAHFTVNQYETLISSRALSGDLFINYTYSPKVVVGLGGTAGYNWVDAPSPDQSFEQANARVSYEVSGKVSLNASVGVEFRQSAGDLRADDYVSPVYELGATYQPFDGTSLNIHGSRRTQNSAVLIGQDYASTNITIGARQRLLRRFYLGLAAGYENSDYFNTIDTVAASRSDDYYFVQPAIDVTLTRYWTAGVYYLHRQSNSSSASFSFDDNQVGLRTSVTF